MLSVCKLPPLAFILSFVAFLSFAEGRELPDDSAPLDSRISLIVPAPAAFKSNLKAAKWFGLLAQFINGHVLQERLQLPDPSARIGTLLRDRLAGKLSDVPDEHLTLVVETNTWGLWDAIGDGEKAVYAGVIIKLKLQDARGKTLVKEVCNSGLPLKDELYVDQRDITEADAPRIRQAFTRIEDNCLAQFAKRWNA